MALSSGVGVVLRSKRVMTEYRTSARLLLHDLARWRQDAARCRQPAGREPVKASRLVGDTADRLGISRYYFDQVARNGQRGSHFYTLVEAEKRCVKASIRTTAGARLPYNEGKSTPSPSRHWWRVLAVPALPAFPVYRLFRGNANFPNDPNHRFTTSLAIYNQFVGPRLGR